MISSQIAETPPINGGVSEGSFEVLRFALDDDLWMTGVLRFALDDDLWMTEVLPFGQDDRLAFSLS